MAAGIATLTQLKTHPPYERLEGLTQRLAEGLITAAMQRHVPIQINRIGSMLTVFFAEGPIRHAVEARASARLRFARWARAMMSEGILIPPSPFEAWFLSSAHTEEDVERMVRAGRAACQRIR
jgi:glutamate-1-semialdehyde 2,1-aminomutase